MKIKTCYCGSGKPAGENYDARGIFLCRTCVDCHDKKMKGYRKEVLTDSNYEADEPIEEDYCSRF